jgi:hypothetical protein
MRLSVNAKKFKLVSVKRGCAIISTPMLMPKIKKTGCPQFERPVTKKESLLQRRD